MRALGSSFSGLALACVAVAFLATASFFLLHHAGNQIPYDLAVQRFKAEMASDRPDEGHAKGYKSRHEYCEMSSAVTAGARDRQSSEASALRNAVMLRQLTPKVPVCHALETAVDGAAVGRGTLKTRNWWGGKALYAIALRWLSVYQIRELTKVATGVAYLLLGISLLLLGPKMLLLAAPLLVFGAFFSATEYWAGVANGFPYLWTVLFATALALLTRLERGARERGSGMRTVPVFCFLGGTVSSYLWMGDGHTFLAVVWIGMVVWFGRAISDLAERTRRAAACIVLYGAGIVVCYALGQLVKAAFAWDRVWSTFWRGLVHAIQDSMPQGWRWLVAPDEMSALAYLDSFYKMAWPGWLPADFVPTFVAVFSLAAALGFAIFEARRGRAGLLWGVLWIVCLIAVSSVTFLIVEHQHWRTARFAFVPLALCLSCLVLAVGTVDWRRLATTWQLPAVLVVAGLVAWYLAKFELSATARLIDSVRDMRPVVRSVFDVYLDGDRVIYVKEEQCSDADEDAPFFLFLYPVDVADLPVPRQQHGFDNLEFDFRTIGRREGERCAAGRLIPDYPVDFFDVGQYLPGKGRLWSGRFSPKDLEPSSPALDTKAEAAESAGRGP